MKWDRIKTAIYCVSICMVCYVVFIMRFINAYAESSEVLLKCNSRGEMETNADSNSFDTIMLLEKPGDMVEMKIQLQNEYNGEKTDYVGFYLKTYADCFDPEKEAYSYSKFKNTEEELRRELEGIVKEDDEDYYNRLEESLIELTSLTECDTFSQKGRTEEEKAVLSVIRRLEYEIVEEDNAHTLKATQIEENGLLKLAGLLYEEKKMLTVKIRVPDDLTTAEQEILKQLHWEFTIKKLGAHPDVMIEFKILNQPKNGKFFVFDGLDKDGLPLSLDGLVNYQLIAENTGNVPISLYQINVGNIAFTSGENLQPGDKKEISGWYIVTEEMAQNGEYELKGRFEGVLENPDIRDHLIIYGSAQFSVGFPENNPEITKEFITSDKEQASYSEFSTEVVIEETSGETSSKRPNKVRKLIPIIIVITISAVAIMGIIIFGKRKSNQKGW